MSNISFTDLPAEIRNQIYRDWAKSTDGRLPLAEWRTATALLRSSGAVAREATYFFYQLNHPYFLDLKQLYMFLATRTQWERANIHTLEFDYNKTEYAFDAFELLLSFSGLKTLIIGKGFPGLTLNSPGTWVLLQLRRLHTVRFKPPLWAPSALVRKELRRALKLTEDPIRDGAWHHKLEAQRAKHSRKLQLKVRRARLGSLRKCRNMAERLMHTR